MAQPITSLIALATFDLLSINADLVLSAHQDELVQSLTSQMFDPENGTEYVILVGDPSSYGYLVNHVAVSSYMIVLYTPSDTLLDRLDEVITPETNLIIWNYFSVPYGHIPEVMKRKWKSKTIYALYLDWAPDEWAYVAGQWGFL